MTDLKSCTTLPTVISGNNFLSSSLIFWFCEVLQRWLLIIRISKSVSLELLLLLSLIKLLLILSADVGADTGMNQIMLDHAQLEDETTEDDYNTVSTDDNQVLLHNCYKYYRHFVNWCDSVCVMMKTGSRACAVTIYQQL